MSNEEKFPCLYCHDMFEDAEDYKNHLRHVHKVVKKLDEGVLVAKKKAGIPVICHFVEEITIDDDIEKEENISISDVNTRDESVLTNEVTHISDIHQVTSGDWEEMSTRNIFELSKYDVEEFAKVSSANLFRQSRQILTAQKGEIKTKEEDQDDLVTDHDIDMFFEKLRNKISNIELDIQHQHSKSEATESGNKNISDFKSTVARALTPRASNIEAEVSFCGPWTSTMEAEVSEVSSKRRPRQTIFLCPLADCPDNFSTSRAGMESGEAARHLNTRHGVTPDMVTPGRYKFRKIKVVKD